MEVATYYKLLTLLILFTLLAWFTLLTLLILLKMKNSSMYANLYCLERLERYWGALKSDEQKVGWIGDWMEWVIPP